MSPMVAAPARLAPHTQHKPFDMQVCKPLLPLLYNPLTAHSQQTHDFTRLTCKLPWRAVQSRLP
jgi:hypothetical protein